MNFYIADKSDKNNIKHLWACAFSEQEPFLSEYFNNFWKSENAVIVKSDTGELLGASQLIPYSIFMRNEIVKSSYIVGVSVPLKYRGLGISTKLMKAVLYEERKRGDLFSLLIPFNYDFYKKLGYEMCYTLFKYSFAPRDLKFKKITSVKKLSAKDFIKINKLYEKFVDGKNAYNFRTKEDWEYIFTDLLTSDGYIFGNFCGETLTGYASLFMHRNKLLIREIVYDNEETFKALLTFIASEFSNCAKIELILPSSIVLPDFLTEIRHSLTEKPYAMLRVTDVERVLSLRGCENLKISVTDMLIEENNGTFCEKNGVITKTNEPGDVKISIGAFSQLVSGFKNARELNKAGTLTANTDVIDILCKLYPKTNNYINHIME